MGLLSEGTPLSWAETKKLADHVRTHGIIQFINLYKKLKDRKDDCLKWGDEIEYILVYFDHNKKLAKVSLRAAPVLNQLQQAEKNSPEDVKVLWRPEFGAYMLEGTPGKPYGFLISHFNVVEANMRARREEVKKFLEPNEVVLCMTSFPRLGCKAFTHPVHDPTPYSGYLRSLFVPDEVVYQEHPRFLTLARNIRERRGAKVAINIPIYKDANTRPEQEHASNPAASNPALPNHVYMDAMAFGMGCSCLQVTFQASNISEARLLYDQLTPLCPILMALSASSPIHRGVLTDRDCRWSVIASSVDDRTEEEMGLKPLKENKFCIQKSRYDSIDSYLSPEAEPYNDIDIVYDKDIYQQLISADIDHLLAQHIAHLFIRDPISLFSEKIEQKDSEDTDHFENIQSTNWQTMRFKPPPHPFEIGWRVEFRPMEVQMTEFENAAYVVFVVLLTRVILSYRLNFLMPISKVDDNMQEAQKRDAVRQGKFLFRRCITTCGSPPDATEGLLDGGVVGVENTDYVVMSIDEIVNGKGHEFPGLIPLIKKFLSTVEVDVDTQCTIQQYLSLIQRRASGELFTTARWIREFVANHKLYQHDSQVSDTINYDLLVRAAEIQNGKAACPELMGTPTTKTHENIPSAVKKAMQSGN